MSNFLKMTVFLACEILLLKKVTASASLNSRKKAFFMNLIDFIDQANAPTKNGSRQSIKLEKCPDPKAYVEFTVRSVLLTANHTGAETISLGSDGMNSDPDSEFDFGDIDRDDDRKKRVMTKRNREQS